jgi:hypothetical protein
MIEKLKLDPEEGMTEGYGEEGGLRFYESSMRHAQSGKRLVTVITHARGIRLTAAQARELHDWLEAWLREHE